MMDHTETTRAIHSNVGTVERLLSVAGGSFLLFNALANRKLSFGRAIAAAYLVFRGSTGYCPMSHAVGKTEVNYRAPNVNIKTAISINRPRHTVYAFWRTLDNLPLFVKDMVSVRQLDHNTSAWKMRFPGGIGAIQWTSEIVKEEPGEFLSWHSLSDAGIENSGKVEFRDAGKFGTEVYLVISYHAPLGAIGEKTARLINPFLESRVRETLKNLKRYMETGEIPTIKGQPSGRERVRETINTPGV